MRKSSTRKTLVVELVQNIMAGKVSLVDAKEQLTGKETELYRIIKDKNYLLDLRAFSAKIFAVIAKPEHFLMINVLKTERCSLIRFSLSEGLDIRQKTIILTSNVKLVTK